MTTGTQPTQDELRERACRALAGGVSSNTRLLNPHLIIERAQGSRIWDADGKEYLDYLLGQGPNFLGYAPPRVTEKVLAAQQAGIIYAATHIKEIEAAERLIAALGWPEMMRFGSSSTEMVQAAMRMARAATARPKIVRFHGHYHGWIDNIYVKTQGEQAVPFSEGQPASALSDLITISWNDEAAIREVFDRYDGQIAGVLMEPIMMNAGAILPLPGYLETVRDLCAKAGTVLIFDETITGFRLALGGAIERTGVTPDLAVYGKAMAAGYPCSALVGKRDLFARVATSEVAHLGTFNGNTIATAAVLASLDELESGDVYRQVEAVGTTVMTGLRQLASNHGLELHLQGFPMAFHASFNPSGKAITSYEQLQAVDAARYSSLARALVDCGVWVAYRGIWYVSAAHTPADVTETMRRVDLAFDAWVAAQ